MATPTDPRREFQSTYVVQDRSSEEELTRLQLQDHLVTASMGGVLPEQPDPASFGHVLDVGCGTGGWLIEAAKTYPSMSLLVGVDISGKMVEYARRQAEAQGVSDRVQFHVMDALLTLEFPPAYFHLVNQRLGMSYMRTWEWPKLLQEFGRITRPGGVVRLTEADMQFQSTSAALLRLNRLLRQTFHLAGYLFTPESDGLTGELARLLTQFGFHNVQTCVHTREYRGKTAEGQAFAEDMRLGFRTLVPFMRKWIRVPDDYEAVYQQMLGEVQQPDFVATGSYLTAWGTR